MEDFSKSDLDVLMSSANGPGVVHFRADAQGGRGRGIPLLNRRRPSILASFVLETL